MCISLEQIPVYPHDRIPRGPYFKRYFLKPIDEFLSPQQTEEDFIAETVMHINTMPDAFVVSSGKDIGVFSGWDTPEDIADYFRIEDYKGYMGRPQPVPHQHAGVVGGAHPFTILDKAVVHNGEITSYGTNVRWLEMNGYRCLLQTDTEVISYIYDKADLERQTLKKDACFVMAPAPSGRISTGAGMKRTGISGRSMEPPLSTAPSGSS